MTKVAIITGSSRGIGAATARLLARNGYRVCVNFCKNSAKAEEVLREINLEGGEGMIFEADVSAEPDVIKLFAAVKDKYGQIDALVNNAGISGETCSVEDVSFDCLSRVFHINVFGAFLCSREAIKQMKQNGGGCIVNVSSEASKFGGNRMAHYAASKAAVSALTIAVAREVAPYNIRVNTVSPGVIDTDLHAAASIERLQALKNSLPMGRMGSPEEVAESIYWLLSEKASYLNGASISVSGAR